MKFSSILITVVIKHSNEKVKESNRLVWCSVLVFIICIFVGFLIIYLLGGQLGGIYYLSCSQVLFIFVCVH